MILLSHPRSGSNWFMSGLKDYGFTFNEMFGTPEIKKQFVPSTYAFKNISMQARLIMAKNSKNKFYKIQFSDIDRNSNIDEKNYLIENLSKIDNLYLLIRRDIKKTLISFAIGFKNNWNFHGDNSQLTKKFTLNLTELLDYYDICYGSIDRYKNQFRYKEIFVYEDLISGRQIPKTLSWDPNLSQIKQRNSMDFVHLIENWNEVEKWLNEFFPENQYQI